MEKEKRYLFPADYMADPSVHVFNDRIYIYPSHDWECDNTENDNGDQYVMKDSHVLSTTDPMHGEVIDHGKALDIADVPWAGRQLWDSDVAEKDGKYYLYFPIKDKTDIFRTGVAIADRPEGPFVPQYNPQNEMFAFFKTKRLFSQNETYLLEVQRAIQNNFQNLAAKGGICLYFERRQDIIPTPFFRFRFHRFTLYRYAPVFALRFTLFRTVLCTPPRFAL